MNKTIKDATIKMFEYETVEQFKVNLDDFLNWYNAAKKLKALKRKAPYYFIIDQYKLNSKIFHKKPDHYRMGLNKFAVPVIEGFCSDSKPLARIYILQETDKKTIRLETLQRIVTIPLLKHHIYRKMGLLQRHIDQCTYLANNYPMKVLHRPNDLSLLSQLTDCLGSGFQ